MEVLHFYSDSAVKGYFRLAARPVYGWAQFRTVTTETQNLFASVLNEMQGDFAVPRYLRDLRSCPNRMCY